MQVLWLLLLSLLLTTGLPLTRAAAEQRDQRDNIYADPVVGPREFGPARYNTTLYDQRHGRWPGGRAQAAPEDRFNQKSAIAEQAGRPALYGDEYYPFYDHDCALGVDDQFKERSYTRLVCPGVGRSAGAPPLLWQGPPASGACCSPSQP